MLFSFRIILLSICVVSVLSFDQNIHRSKKCKKEIPLKFRELVKRAIDENNAEKILIENSENNSEIPVNATKEEPKENTTEAPVEVKSDSPTNVINDVHKEEPKKEETRKDLDLKIQGERIEKEGEEEERAVTPETPKEVEDMTPSSATPSPPIITRPTLPSIPTATVPPNTPVFTVQPTFPTNNFPNYWENPNWGNWGRFVPTQSNWGQQWPSFNWPSSRPSVPQVPSFTTSNTNPSRYTPSTFGAIPSSGIPTFSFIVPQNTYPGGRGFQYPGSQPSYPRYEPRYIPSGSATPGYYPGAGGQTPGYYPRPGGQTPSYYPGGNGQTPSYYPGIGGQNPSYYPGIGGQQPGYYPGAGGQSPRFYPDIGREQPGMGGQPQQPPQQPGADPNRPMGPMGPEFNDPDVTMIDPNQVGPSGGRGYPESGSRIMSK